MMALFIVLWIVGQSNAVKQAISAYFKDPGVFESGRGGGILPGTSGSAPTPTSNAAIEMEKLKVEAKKIEEAIASTPEFNKFKDKIQITVTKEGLRIELVENSSGLFFDVGSAQVKPETVKLLKLVAKEIGRLNNNIMIEGYTDARPYVKADYSNWELSSDRANTARRILEDEWGQTRPDIAGPGFCRQEPQTPRSTIGCGEQESKYSRCGNPGGNLSECIPPKTTSSPTRSGRGCSKTRACSIAGDKQKMSGAPSIKILLIDSDPAY